MLWLHARGPAGVWDAPLELRTQHRDDEAPDYPPHVVPPQAVLPYDADPDLRTALRWDYAAQVNVLDRCVEALWQQLEESGQAESTWVLLTSPRGYPLGEHSRLGFGRPSHPADPACLHEELLHVPLVILPPGARHTAERRSDLVQPADVCATLCSALGLSLSDTGRSGRDLLRDADDGDASPREAICLAVGDERAIRTPAWFLRWWEVTGNAVEGSPGLAELYVKPDDRWEVSDVADRVPAVIEPLQAAFAARRAWQAGESIEPPPRLPDELLRHGF
jgi:arylsulfatase A-like enzyme